MSREFWLHKKGTGCADPDYQAMKPDPSIEDQFIHVIEATPLTKSAPELLEVLKDVTTMDVDWDEMEYTNPRLKARILSAISKSQGAANEKI